MTGSPRNASRPGRSPFSSSSRLAPPPVDTWSTSSSSLNWASAAAESPPPTTVNAFVSAIAWATVRVPAANRSSSNMPIGPFQNTIRASMITSLNAAAEPGPMSNPLHPSPRRLPNVAKLPPASTPVMSSGRWIVLPFAVASSSNRLHVSTMSGSNSESPIGRPRAAKNVKHIAPPITIESTMPSSASTTPSLSEIFAPPSTATNGWRGLSRSPSRTSTSFCSSRPIADGTNCGGPTIDAWARCEAPNASLT